MTELEDLSIRVRRLEQLHIWGLSIIAVSLVYVLLKQKENGIKR